MSESENIKKKFVDKISKSPNRNKINENDTSSNINKEELDTTSVNLIENDVDSNKDNENYTSEYEELLLRYSDLEAKFNKMQVLCARLDNDNKSLKLALERKENEIVTTKKFATSGLLKDIISSFENFEKELLSFDRSLISDNKDLLNFLQGADLTFSSCRKVFINYGLVLISPKVGDLYNHEFHNALQVVKNSEMENGTIVTILQDGYTIYDRLLRPALVVIVKND